jgi:hypothetical protein
VFAASGDVVYFPTSVTVRLRRPSFAAASFLANSDVRRRTHKRRAYHFEQVPSIIHLSSRLAAGYVNAQADFVSSASTSDIQISSDRK